MIKKSDLKNIGIVAGGGVLLILGLFWLGSTTDLFSANYYQSSVYDNAKKQELERKISNYEKGDNNPEEFYLLGVEIAAAQSAGLIQKSTANYFIQRLEDAYKKHVFDLSEKYLKNIYADKSEYINNLQHLKTSIGDSPEIARYIDQINKTHFYLHVWPPKVRMFLDERAEKLVYHWKNLSLPLWDFPHDDVESVRYRLINTQGLENQYKNHRIRKINQDHLEQLEILVNAYERYEIEHILYN